MRKRAQLLTPIQNTTAQYNLPELGKKIAYKSNREGIAERFPDPNVRQSIEVDLALIDYYNQLLNDLERATVRMAKQHNVNPCYRLRSIPGVGKILALTLLYKIQSIECFPRVQDFASSARLVKCSRESAGNHDGHSGKKIGNGPLQWAFSEAAVPLLRQHPPGQDSVHKVAAQHGKPKARSILAHQRGRVVYVMRKRHPAVDRGNFLTA